jgi:hypothetical protein
VADASFVSNNVRIAGVTHALSSGFICLAQLLVLSNSSDGDGWIGADSEHNGNYSLAELVHISANGAAKLTGGTLRKG